jgi:TIR domain/Pentapeptide repeats (8 copies)
VNLSHANLRLASLHGADLTKADLTGANLTGAYLHHTNLSKADLRGANLKYAHLIMVNLSFAKLGQTSFANTDLTGAEGLESCRHLGPSSVGIDTFFKSKGELPDSFLRGCGVPDVFITYARSLAGQTIEFYSCFISYSSNDQQLAERLYSDLQAKGVRRWFAPHHVQGGQKVHEQIDAAIQLYEKLLLILSPHSMNSEWVKTEIALARKREVREKRKVLFPVSLVAFEALREWECFDADTGKDSAREIREYFIPDFSNWKDLDSYQKAFEKLLHDLKAADRASE